MQNLIYIKPFTKYYVWLGWHLGNKLEASVRRMADTLIHRGPDDGGVWSDEARGIALGFRRLAIIDLSPQGRVIALEILVVFQK